MSPFFSVALLVILSIWIFFRVLQLYQKNRFFTFEILALSFFAIFYPLSGIAHIVFSDNYYRGFFDTINRRSLDSVEHLNLMAVSITYVAALALFLGLNSRRSSPPPSIRYAYSKANGLIFYGISISLTSLLATFLLFSSIDISSIERVRQFSPGTAKLIIMSSWLGWGISYIYLVLIKKRKITSSIAITATFLLSILTIYLNIVWTGGRSIGFVLAMPLTMIVLRLKHNLKFYILAPYTLFLVFYIVWVTLLRTEGYSSYNISISGFLDWEFGRYSMTGYAADYVERYDYLFGESWAYAIYTIVSGPLHLLGFRDLWSSGSSLISTIGLDIFGSRDSTYVVPGLVPEAFMNFGYPGVFFALFVVGKLINIVDQRFSNNLESSIPRSLFYAFIGTLICLNLLNATFQAFLNYIFFSGFPLIFALIFFKRTRRATAQKKIKSGPL